MSTGSDPTRESDSFARFPSPKDGYRPPRTTAGTSGTIARTRSQGRLSIPCSATIAANTSGRLANVAISFEIPFIEWRLADPSKFMSRVRKHVWVSVAADASFESLTD
ncbi:MAG: hypothetical protein GY906_03365 [bacterium]|nr:hypothetical protein [bacterium]